MALPSKRLIPTLLGLSTSTVVVTQFVLPMRDTLTRAVNQACNPAVMDLRGW